MAFYDETFSFREFLQVHPEMNALIIDTLAFAVLISPTLLLGPLRRRSRRRRNLCPKC